MGAGRDPRDYNKRLHGSFGLLQVRRQPDAMMQPADGKSG